MTRDLFLKELRIALQGQISQAEVNEHLRYYENYIMEESRKGKTEEQVLEELGNPRLIAKTIIERAAKGNSVNFNDNKDGDVPFKKNKSKFWYGWIILAIMLVILFVSVTKIIIVLIPILLPAILVIGLLYLLFYGNRK